MHRILYMNINNGILKLVFYGPIEEAYYLKMSKSVLENAVHKKVTYSSKEENNTKNTWNFYIFFLQVIELSYKLQHLYLGCSESEIALVQQLRLRAWALQLVVQLRGSGSNTSSGSSASHLAQRFLTRATAMQEWVQWNLVITRSDITKSS